MITTSIATDAETPQLIGGVWRAASGPAFEVVDPTTGRPLASVGSSTAADVHSALAAASSARAAWSAATLVERGDYLRLIADVFARHRQTLQDLLVTEVGKPVAEAAGEVASAIEFLRYHAAWDRRLEGEILPGEVAGESIHLLRVPLGVVVAICPWNYPLGVLCRKLAPALLTGNTVVVKPSEVTPLCTIEAVRLIHREAGLPPGVLNLVVGGAPTGEALVGSPLTSLVSFTGHRDTGKRVMATAAVHLTRVSLELGGKAPAIVWSDADLDLAVAAIVEARHTNAGQVCTSAERVFVHRDVLAPFTERYVAAVSALVVGDPSGPVDMGPLVSVAQLRKTTLAVAQAVEEGAEILTGGDRPIGPEFSAGHWYRPTVLRNVRPDSRIMQEETFGPVTPILGITSFDEALSLANDSRYGLSAYLFSRDYRMVMAAVDRLDFGEIYINRTLGESVHAHHSGFKESGIGGEDGKWGLLRYTQIKTAYHHYS